MERSSFVLFGVGFVFLTLLQISSATLSPAGINYEVVALWNIRMALHDPYNVLENWDINSVDPCTWRMVTCSPDGYVSALGLPSQSLSGTLSSAIENLTNLQSVLLQNNDISGGIPAAIGKLEKLQTLDLSNNSFSGEIPSFVGSLKNLNYLRLSNNSLTGPIPQSLSNNEGLTLVDLSYNNLSGSLPKALTRTFKVTGNPLLCGPKPNDDCSAVFPEPLTLPPDAQSNSGSGNHHIAVAFGASFGVVFSFIVVVGLLVWWRYRRNQQIFFDVNEQYDPKVWLGLKV